ncbi:hypothetical protein [Syntrophomonas palmitatica]|uniref:hypothetical protein n=1 Tax=Syntrophomonas palmitatica TaxID=402877 RepID=UPI0012ED924F|nr:hypothetical protein [Syntrophomonas palmitatica]
MNKMAVGETVTGIVTEIRQENGKAESLVLTINNHKKAIIPISELPETNVSGVSAIRHLARKYMNRDLAGVVISEQPLALSYLDAVKSQTEKVILQVGDEINATVVWTSKNYAELEYKNIPLGMFAEEYGWVKYIDLRTILNRGDNIRVEVLETKEGETIKVSHKKYAPNPWPNIVEKYHPKNQYLARVKSLLKPGVVVSLEPGLDMLCSPYPFFEVKVNDEVAVEIVDINPDAGKMKGYITAQANRKKRG